MPKLFQRIPAQQPARSPCPIAFIAEAPGDTDVCTGKALSGPDGRLFNKMLRMAGIAREDCWVGHVFDERPPEGDVGAWCQKEKPEGEPMKLPGKGYLLPEHHY